MVGRAKKFMISKKMIEKEFDVPITCNRIPCVTSAIITKYVYNFSAYLALLTAGSNSTFCSGLQFTRFEITTFFSTSQLAVLKNKSSLFFNPLSAKKSKVKVTNLVTFFSDFFDFRSPK